MILLDTDVLTLVQRVDSPAGLRIRARIAELPADEHAATTIITYEEQIRGWFLRLSKATGMDDQIAVYDRILKHIDNYRRAVVLPFNRPAADHFERLRKQKIRIGTPDLKIAAIALSLTATLITRNLHDFAKVPDLRIEDWTKT